MDLIIRKLGQCDYLSIWHNMRQFTMERTSQTNDEIWLLAHQPVYTLGLFGRREHILDNNDIPVIQTDRGGQVTYHGPGQLIVYTLIDIARCRLGVRNFVNILEQAVINLFADYGINAHNRPTAPGVYVANSKIAAVGLRIRHGCVYHGLSININMDLTPFLKINPCGYAGLTVTQLYDLNKQHNLTTVAEDLVLHLIRLLPQSYIKRYEHELS